MRRVECDLFDLGEVVLNIFVKDEFADLAERELLLRPNVGQVKDVDLLLLPKVLSLLRGHHLNRQGPRRIFSSFNRLVQVLLTVVGRLGRSLVIGKGLVTLVRLHMNLGVHPIAILVDELESMPTVAIHVTESVRDTSIAHEDHDLVNRFRVV